MPATAGAYSYVPDGCGNGGQIGIRFYQGGTSPFSTWNANSYLTYTGTD